MWHVRLRCNAKLIIVFIHGITWIIYLFFAQTHISFDKFLHLSFHSFSFKLFNQHQCYLTNKGKHRCFRQKFDSLFRLNFSQNIFVHIRLSSLESMLFVRKCMVKLSNYSRKTVLLNMALIESHGEPHSKQISGCKLWRTVPRFIEGASPNIKPRRFSVDNKYFVYLTFTSYVRSLIRHDILSIFNDCSKDTKF